MFCSFYLILYIIWFQFSLYFITLIIMSTSILHPFFFTCFLLLKMHYLDHILECPIGPSLKVVQLRRLFDWSNMAAALPQFFGAASHPCFEVSDDDSPSMWRFSTWRGPLARIHRVQIAQGYLSVHTNAETIQRFSRAGPRGRAREWATLGVHPLSWLLSNNR